MSKHHIWALNMVGLFECHLGVVQGCVCVMRLHKHTTCIRLYTRSASNCHEKQHPPGCYAWNSHMDKCNSGDTWTRAVWGPPPQQKSLPPVVHHLQHVCVCVRQSPQSGSHHVLSAPYTSQPDSVNTEASIFLSRPWYLWDSPPSPLSIIQRQSNYGQESEPSTAIVMSGSWAGNDETGVVTLLIITQRSVITGTRRRAGTDVCVCVCVCVWRVERTRDKKKKGCE